MNQTMDQSVSPAIASLTRQTITFLPDEFEVTASAESASDSAKISLTINSVNDAGARGFSVESDDSEYPIQIEMIL